MLVIALVGACEDIGAQTTGVVQETNAPCTQETCPCDREHFYGSQVIRVCSGLQATISVCSDVPVCDAVLQDVVAAVTACAESSSPFAIDLGACD